MSNMVAQGKSLFYCKVDDFEVPPKLTVEEFCNGNIKLVSEITNFDTTGNYTMISDARGDRLFVQDGRRFVVINNSLRA